MAESPVPAQRLAALLLKRRVELGLDLAEMSQRSAGAFTPSVLAGLERGTVLLDDRAVERVVKLYGLDAGPVVADRAELILDLERQELAIGDRALAIESWHSEDVLERYVSLVYLLRGARPGTELVLRDDDLLVLGSTLGLAAETVRREVAFLTAVPVIDRRVSRLRSSTAIVAAGLLVAVTVAGGLVFVLSRSTEATGPVVTTPQSLVTTQRPALVGAAAERLIAYDFRTNLPGWEIRYEEDNPDYLGITLSAQKSIIVHVEPNASAGTVSEILMHEVGHAIDLERLSDAQRAEWIELRTMPATWWPGDGLSDFAVGAGDFAEAVAAVTTGSASRSAYGEFTAEQLAWAAAVLDAG